MSPTAFSQRARPALVAAALLLAVAASCRAGCGPAPLESRPLGGRLALFPSDARTVLAVDAEKLRAAPEWGRLASLDTELKRAAPLLAELTARTGLDPWRDLQSVVVGFPAHENAGGAFGVVLRSRHLDRARLVAYAREQLQQQGDDLVASIRGERTLWARRSDPSWAGFFLDDHTLVLGGGGWGMRMAELSQGGPPSASAETNIELLHLGEQVARHAFWGAAIISPETRAALQREPRLRSAASVSRVAIGLDLRRGLHGRALAELSNEADAKALARGLGETVREAKRHPGALMLGLGPHLDALSARAQGPRLEVAVSLSEAQLGDLLDALAARLRRVGHQAPPGFPAP